MLTDLMPRIYTFHIHELFSGTFTRFCPDLPYPGMEVEPTDNPASHDRSDLLNSLTCPSFRYFCELWQIAHEIVGTYFSQSRPASEFVDPSFANMKYHNLSRWAQRLPAECARSQEMSHSVAEMQWVFRLR